MVSMCPFIVETYIIFLAIVTHMSTSFTESYSPLGIDRSHSFLYPYLDQANNTCLRNVEMTVVNEH